MITAVEHLLELALMDQLELQEQLRTDQQALQVPVQQEQPH